MEPDKLNSVNNFNNFIKQQKEIIDSFAIGINVSNVLQVEELFSFLNEHFEKFNQKENLRIVLSFVHRCLKVWIYKEDYIKDDIGILLVNLLVEHYGVENDMGIVIQIVYQVLYSIRFIGCNDIVVSEKLLRELIATLPLIKSRTLASNYVACIQKYVEIFPKSLKNLETLWSTLKQQIDSNLRNGLTNENEIDILIQFFENFKSFLPSFHDEPILIITIQHLLKSDQKKFRKCGYYLLKKICHCFIENIHKIGKMWMPSDHNQQIELSWTIYITILENLEEEQSHLILPSLENIEKLIKSNKLSPSWLNILYMRILTHKNKLVLRWSIEFFLKTFSCTDFCAENLKQLLEASNSNSLYNYEGYFLKDEYFASFLNGDVTVLISLFSEIVNWKSVPLYTWIKNLNKTPQLMKLITFEQILNISACVRKMQNCLIRSRAISYCNLFFDDFIKKMSLKEYVTYIETLYNYIDEYENHLQLFSKISSVGLCKESTIFQQRFYNIFTNNHWDNADLLLFLKDIPVKQHGWLKFAPFKYKLSEYDRKCINEWYTIDLNSLTYGNIHELINIFGEKMLNSIPYDKNELIECNQAAISFYIFQKSSLKDEDEDTLRFILNSGIKHHEALDIFAEKLLVNNTHKINLYFIDELLKYKSSKIISCVSLYLCKVYDVEVVKNYAKIIVKHDSSRLCLFDDFNLLKYQTNECFKQLASQGDKRIEEAFVHEHLILKEPWLNIYHLEQLRLYQTESFALDLLKHHTDITKQKPRYFENSNEHRAKLRIAILIYHYFIYSNVIKTVLDLIWSILLYENNQNNIIYIYEYILGRFEFREDIIINKLKMAKQFTSSQQVSVIAVTYIYYTYNPFSDEIIYALLSLSMGANFQTRLFAQMSLYKLLKNKNDGTERFQQIIQSIKDSAGGKLDEYLNDIRFNLTVVQNDVIHAVLYITNAPFDEVINPFYIQCCSVEVQKQIECCRERFTKKLKATKNEETTSKSESNYQIQRKMNPVNDLTEPPNLIVYPTEEKIAEMFVIASLIDKLPNLGGIARTCEVLGIKNLVMDSKMHTEKNDFKNLSMTAEKTLNILEVKPKDLKEFLLLKKLEGYDIIGAEQTCNSQSFNNFKFPEKCILLLGHEKDGIPAPLLGLLDNAVEIPQFGQVRSLNVHVTGALFMWEYCKQHLIQKK